MILGYRLRKASNYIDNKYFSLYGVLTFIIALVGSVSIFSYFFLKGDSWTIENKMSFQLIAIVLIGLSVFYLGFLLLRDARKGGNKIAQITGLVWLFTAVSGSSLVIFFVLKMNDGWTLEKQAQVMSSCEAMADQGSLFNCPCYVRKVIITFENPEDYNNAMENEENGKKTRFLAKMSDDCPCGAKSYDESEVESVDLPF
jgi:hypothetical protein